MTVTIRQVRVGHFRGIAEPMVLDLDGRGLILLGDNGAGKSSLLEAIEYGLTGTVASLSRRGQRVSVKRHAGHVCSSGVPEVTVVLQARNEVQEVGPDTRLEELAEPFRSYVAAARGRQFLLRRSHVLELIEAADRDRYAALAPFLGVHGFVRVEGFLGQLSQKADLRGRKQAEELEDAARPVLRRVGSVEPVEVQRWLEARAAVAGVAVPQDLSQLARRVASSVQAGPVDPASIRVRLENVIDALPSGDDLGALDAELTEARRWDESETIRYEVVLEQGIRWLLDNPEPRCPLCEGEVDTRAVVERARKRLHAASAAVEARRRAATALDRVASGLLRARQELQALRREGPSSPRFAALWAASEWLEQLGSQLRGGHREVDVGVVQGAAPELARIREMVEEARTTVHSADERERALDDLRWAAEGIPTWEASRQHHETLRAVAHRAGALHAHASAARRQAAQEVLEATGSDVTRIYGEFHSGEEELSVKLEMKEGGRGSAKVLVDFLAQSSEDPRGLLSEGHLDTLGLAMFFALHQHTGAAFGLLMLDDVLGTIDTGHRERLVRWLMREVAPDRQLIVTTHSRQWWEWLLHLQRTEGVGDRFRHHEVVRDSGGVAALVGVDTRLAELKRVVDEHGSPIQIGQLAGRILEAELRQLRIAWRLAVSARPGERYTIGDLWDVAHKALRKRVCAAFAERVGPVCQVINGLSPIRNWSAHPNDWTDLSRADAERFAIAVRSLVELMRCPVCQRRLVLQPSKAVMCPKHHPGGMFLPVSEVP